MAVCEKCGHETKIDKSNLNSLFWNVLIEELNQGSEKKARAWIAQYAVNNTKDFMKEFTKLQPKDVKIDLNTTLNYIKVGSAKDPIPENLPILTEGEGKDVITEPEEAIN